MNLMKAIIFTLLIPVLAIQSLYGQSQSMKNETHSAVTFGGQAMISINDKSLFSNMGGGGIVMKS